jgi:hypothetical protein
MAFYLTWVTIASCLNLSIYLTYEANFEVSFSSSISLGIIAILVFIYFVVENFIWQHYLVYIFTPWLVLIIGLSGSLLKNYSFQKPTRNNLITFGILIGSLLFSVIKLLMCFLYHTVCKEKLDRKESHRLLQCKQNKLLKQKMSQNNSLYINNGSNFYNYTGNCNNTIDENVNNINNSNIFNTPGVYVPTNKISNNDFNI